jgi:hypothetical protein
MPTSTSESLPAFFPLVREGCQESADQFFLCLQEKSEPRGSSASARLALQECGVLQDKYSKCVSASLDRKGAKKPIVLTEWEN